MRSGAAFLLLGALGVLAAACAKPESREYFARSDGSGEYSFVIEFDDTAALYDLSLYYRRDKALFRRDTLVSFPLKMVWQAPSGLFFSETVHCPADSVRVRYRSGLAPGEAGEWTLRATAGPEASGLRGLGIICRRRPLAEQNPE